jgi:NADH:ubiquinone oxidoreductase subunit E
MNDLPQAPRERGAGEPQPREFFGAEDPSSRDAVAPSEWEAVDRFLDEGPGGPERLIPVLLRVQHRLGYVPYPIQEYVASRLGLAPVRAVGVISFYRAFSTVPPARHQIRICLCPSCSLGGADAALSAALDVCGLTREGRSGDGLFDVASERSLGVCGLEPVLTVDGVLHRGLSPVQVREMVRRLKQAAADGSGDAR